MTSIRNILWWGSLPSHPPKNHRCLLFNAEVSLFKFGSDEFWKGYHIWRRNERVLNSKCRGMVLWLTKALQIWNIWNWHFQYQPYSLLEDVFMTVFTCPDTAVGFGARFSLRLPSHEGTKINVVEQHLVMQGKQNKTKQKCNFQTFQVLWLECFFFFYCNLFVFSSFKLSVYTLVSVNIFCF